MMSHRSGISGGEKVPAHTMGTTGAAERKTVSVCFSQLYQSFMIGDCHLNHIENIPRMAAKPYIMWFCCKLVELNLKGRIEAIPPIQSTKL